MQAIIDSYLNWVSSKPFPCIAAKAASAKQQIKCMVAGHLACPADDAAILKFLYGFVDIYRESSEKYHSAAIIFKEPVDSEEMFDQFLWKRLQSLADLDAKSFPYDERVSADPQSQKFSFSIGQEAFYIIGLHPASSRQARQFMYPTIVFNPHDQFEALRETGKYDTLKKVVRKRDIALSGSINPMLQDFGTSSEAFQYSGRLYDKSWTCPLKIHHATTEHNSTT